MDLREAIAIAAGDANTIVQSVDPACMSDPSPCTDWDVQTLAQHMFGFAGLAISAANKEPYSEAEFDFADWKPRYAGLADALTAAWAAPGALDGMTTFGGPEMPAERAAALTLQELVLHGWDLAAATGQDYEPAPEVAAAIRMVVEKGAENARAVGAYGPTVEVSPESGEFDRALAGSGRDPKWSAI